MQFNNSIGAIRKVELAYVNLIMFTIYIFYLLYSPSILKNGDIKTRGHPNGRN